jgi:hypothetical protein
LVPTLNVLTFTIAVVEFWIQTLIGIYTNQRVRHCKICAHFAVVQTKLKQNLVTSLQNLTLAPICDVGVAGVAGLAAADVPSVPLGGGVLAVALAASALRRRRVRGAHRVSAGDRPLQHGQERRRRRVLGRGRADRVVHSALCDVKDVGARRRAIQLADLDGVGGVAEGDGRLAAADAGAAAVVVQVPLLRRAAIVVELRQAERRAGADDAAAVRAQEEHLHVAGHHREEVRAAGT